MSLVKIGALKHLVEIQELTTTTDDFGFQVESWKTILKTRSMVEFDKSYKLNKEIYGDLGIETASTRIFTFRKHPNIEIGIKQRIIFKDKAYQIYICNNIDEADRFIKVWANLLCQD